MFLLLDCTDADELRNQAAYNGAFSDDVVILCKFVRLSPRDGRAAIKYLAQAYPDSPVVPSELGIQFRTV